MYCQQSTVDKRSKWPTNPNTKLGIEPPGRTKGRARTAFSVPELLAQGFLGIDLWLCHRTSNGISQPEESCTYPAWSKQMNTWGSHIYCRSTRQNLAIVKSWCNLKDFVKSKYGNAHREHVMQIDLISILWKTEEIVAVGFMMLEHVS